MPCPRVEEEEEDVIAHISLEVQKRRYRSIHLASQALLFPAVSSLYSSFGFRHKDIGKVKLLTAF